MNSGKSRKMPVNSGRFSGNLVYSDLSVMLVEERSLESRKFSTWLGHIQTSLGICTKESDNIYWLSLIKYFKFLAKHVLN